MSTWAQIDSDLDIFLEDASRASYKEASRIAAFNRACQYFAVTHTAVFRSVVAEASAYAEGTIVAYPGDFLELPAGGVETDSIRLEPGNVLIPGDGAPSGGVYMTLSDGIYLPGGETQVRLWYYGTYTAVVDGATVVNLPTWAEWALVNLTMGYLLYPSMMNQQMLRQFQTRREAGQPEDNPPRIQAKFCIQQYHEIVGRVPPQDRSTAYTPGPAR